MSAITVGSEDTVGMLVKRWRERRRRSQLDVSLAAGLSAKHLSYIETGRSNPSRDMIERICDELDVPLRERNRFYLAAGFAPIHPERSLADLGAAREAVQAVLTGMEPNPAVAVNVCWDLLAANQTALVLLGGIPDELAGLPVNMLRATLHPDGLASQVRNLGQWRTHVLRRVRRQLERTAADGLADLLVELESYGLPESTTTSARPGGDLVVPLQMATPYGDVAFLYAATVFGSPRDVTLDEIAIETFFPTDPATARILRSLSGP
ncbi:helix-turn-helix domain-containing protein [Kribbella sp. NBC_00889]|uniref:helix-turn-helix domain-containing protein n=1 Tax=Kribbella sp. NBC_00889 TaxID=2975974 RepID=UPI00386B2528|nr:helix-turn-helix transcriptional regulator [Kribbella sp. NBC_00889]